MPPKQSVAFVTLGCARNEVDSEELAGRLDAAGWAIVEDPAHADAVLVNTCGFVDAAKKDSIDALLAASDLKGEHGPKAVVAIGCMSERYGRDLAAELPEADAVLGFDAYPTIADSLRRIVAGEPHVPHAPTDRRLLLPVTPAERQGADVVVPGHDHEHHRRRLDASPVASVKLASGCDRRCSFCAIPSFRGSFVSRRPSDVLGEIAWLGGQGVREIVLVSENSTSYGKDLGDMRLLESVLAAIDEQASVRRIRVAYLQPAEVRPGLLTAIARTGIVAPYYDLSFQHASASVLRRMRRFGSRTDFLELIERIRAVDPSAGIRSNVIVGFPGETQEDFAELVAFVEQARLDAVGVFGYSDEDGTEAAGFTDKLDQEVVDERVRMMSALVDEVMAQRAEDRIGETVDVLVEEIDADTDAGIVWAIGHAGHQGPDDATTSVRFTTGSRTPAVGELVRAVVVDVDGVDLVADPVDAAR